MHNMHRLVSAAIFRVAFAAPFLQTLWWGHRNTKVSLLQIAADHDLPSTHSFFRKRIENLR